MQENKRVHIWVKGRVQGVGFRAHVEFYAARIGVTGWVRNVGYDTVESIAEGTAAQVEQFIETIKQGPRMSRVDESKIEYENFTGEFVGFGVKGSS